MTLYNDIDDGIKELELIKGTISAMTARINIVTDKCIKRGVPLEHIQIIIEEFMK